MKKALIVGINKYPESPLSGCVNDASAFSKIIKTDGDGSPNFDVILKTDVPTKSELKGLILELFKGDSDTALLYFSGHGIINDLGGYLVTPDYQPNDEGVSMDEILKIVNDSKAKNKVIILDCCHSGAMGSPANTNGLYSHIAEGVTILAASRKIESAIEINGHGIFTNLLLSALQGGAADLSGCITPGSVYAYVDQSLGGWDQRPIFLTNISRFTPLRKITPPIKKEVLRKLTEYFPSVQDQFPLDPSFEDTNTKNGKVETIKPYADAKNVAIFKHLQKLQSVGLVAPIGEDFMYFAAMKSTSCELTALGAHYWQLVKKDKI